MDRLELTILVVVSAFNLGLGFLVLLRNTGGRSNRLFAYLTATIVVWQSVNFMCDQPVFYGNALLLNRLATAAGIAMLLPLIAFCRAFPTQDRSHETLWRAVVGVFGLMAVATVTTPWAISSVEIRSWGTNASMGWMYYVMLVVGTGVFLALTMVMFRKYREVSSSQKAQLGYLFAGIALDVAVILVLGGFLPAVMGNNEYVKYQPIGTLALLIPASYAIVRHRFMDLRMVVLRAAAYVALLLVTGTGFVLMLTLGRTFITDTLNLSDNMYLFLAFLILAFGFTPVRKAIERWTDGVFYRFNYHPEQLLGQLGRSMASTLDTQSLSTHVAHELATQMRLSYAAVAYYRVGVLEVSSTNSTLNESDALRLMNLTGIEILVADDTSAGSDEALAMAQCGARLLAPLVMENERIGLVILGAKLSGGMYSDSDMRFVEVLSVEASIAMRNADLFEEKNQRVRELTALNDLAYALGANIELESVLDAAMEQVVAVTAADSGSIMLLDSEDMTLGIATSHGIRGEDVLTMRTPLGEGVAGWVAKSREALILVGDTDPRFKDVLKRDHIVSAISAPIVCKDSVIGVLNVNRLEATDLFTRENLNMVKSFAAQMAIVIENARLYRELQNTILSTIEALAAAVDAKDSYTAGHSSEVTEYTVAIARKMQLPEEEVQMLRIAGTLHDIGKIGIDGQILNKPGRLTDEEFDEMRRHPTIGADILASLDFVRDAVPIILFHHERFGGGGYPSGVAGETIPLGARIIAVADSFDAMTSDRPYRDGMPYAQAIAELKRCTGTQFDPDVVAAFLQVIEDKGLGESQASRHDALPTPVMSAAAAKGETAGGQ